MSRPITGDEFADLLRTFERTAFRLETRRQYNEDYEQEDFRLFLAGTPRQPHEISWFLPWAEQVAWLTTQGKRISRVRVQAEPPTDYQRWEQWIGQWNTAAGEDIRYMPRSTAKRIGLPLGSDWWLLDDKRLILMRYHRVSGDLAGMWLTTRPDFIAPYLNWRDLAVRNATPAEQIAAA
jgi:Family of unknown function (DUF6879)